MEKMAGNGERPSRKSAFIWAVLPGLPKVKWPVKVLDLDEQEEIYLVYCKADNAEFTVQFKKAVPFHYESKEIYEESLFALRRKEKLREAFVEDYQWVFEIRLMNLQIH
ncbi:unnamed protein product [Owenia fusiformis]|nr:unnamed protein product [Owenia fusiformis]